jgi:hypothetical protein
MYVLIGRLSNTFDDIGNMLGKSAQTRGDYENQS